MSILEKARRDMQQIVESDSGFATDVVLTRPDNSQSIEIRAFASTHRISVNPETGQLINAKNVHFSVSESTLQDSSYSVRNASNEVALKGHLITFTDSAGIERTYSINEAWPDETLGLIVCMLGDYE